ncbi:MAG: hypothetical protein ACT4PP_09505 [Sporichthyaceae bacterium]
MSSRGRRIRRPILAAAVALLAACGGQPTVVPAGSAGLEIPQGKPRATTVTDELPTSSEASRAPKAERPSDNTPKQKVPRKPDRSAKAGTAAPAEAVPAPPDEVSAPKSAPVGLALPAPGAYTYAVTGTTTLGPPPPTSTLTVADAGQGSQLWTLDTRREDGAGLIEELTMSSSPGGVYLSAYRLDASTGIAGVILEFAPPEPVLLTPAAGKAGRTWRFDLGRSKDGCSTATAKGELIDPGDPASAKSVRHFRLTTTVRTDGPASCVQVTGARIQDIHHGATSMLPIKLDSDLQGDVAGVAFTATTRSTRTGEGGSARENDRGLPVVSRR